MEVTTFSHECQSVVQVTSLQQEERQPLCLLCILDVSGSMGVTIESGEMHVTPLNLVKHAVVTMSRLMQETDELCILLFSAEAHMLLPWTRMDKPGQERVHDLLRHVSPMGTTYLDKALTLAKESLGSKARVHVLLLTDGQPTSHPAQGFSNLCKQLFQTTDDVTLHTIGFGPDIDADLLLQISDITGGQFLFISDAQMLGTVFVHLLSNLLCMQVVRIRVDNVEQGGLQGGRTRTLFVDTAQILKYGGQAPQALEDWGRTNNHSVKGDKLLRTLYQTLQTAQCSADLDQLRTLLRVSPVEVTHRATYRALLQDLNGEVRLALTPPEKKWSRPYLLSFGMAHRYGLCTNFKDASLQQYKTPLVESLVQKGSEIFTTIPATMLQPLHQATADAIPMQTRYYDSTNPCVARFCRVHMADGSLLAISLVQKGMKVLNGNGKPRTVRCMVASFCTQSLFRVSPTFLVGPQPSMTSTPSVSTSLVTTPSVTTSLVTTSLVTTPSVTTPSVTTSLVTPFPITPFPEDPTKDPVETQVTDEGNVQTMDAPETEFLPFRIPSFATVDEIPYVNAQEHSDSLWVTSHHPVHVYGKMRFPVDVADMQDHSWYQVFSVLLEKEPLESSTSDAEALLHECVMVERVPVLSLAHGLQGPMVSHAFFGTDAVIACLQRSGTFEKGVVFVHSVDRNPETGLVESMRVC